MAVSTNITKPSQSIFKSFVEKRLVKYANSDFTTKQKAHIFYYLCIAGIVSILLLIVTSVIVQMKSAHQQIHLPVVITEVAALLLFFICLVLLRRGHFNVSTHIFLITANVSAWIVMYISKGDSIARIDTVLLILATVNAIPLLIIKYKWNIIGYVGVNITLFVVFITLKQQELSLTSSEIISVGTDAAIAFLFTGIVGFQILKVNRKSIEKVENDYLERLRAEEKLTESELKYRMLFDNAQIGIYQTTPDGKILSSNPALIKMLGYDSLSELNQRNLEKENVFLNTTRRNFKALIEEKGYVNDYESGWLTKDGNHLIVSENARVVKDANGETIFYEGFIENITERKKAEKALKESEEKYRTLIESMNEVVMMVDNNDCVLYVNNRFSDLLGYSKEEIIGKIGYQVLLPPEDQYKIQNENKERTRNKFNQYELSMLSKDGRKTDFLVSGSPVKDAEGNIIGSMGAMTDITERKKNLTALKESEERNRVIIEAFPDIIMISDLEGNIIYGNAMLEKYTGITTSDYRNPNRKAHIHPEDVNIVIKAKEELLSGDKTHTPLIENRFIDTEGQIHWFSGIMSKLTLNNKVVLQTITRDITDKKKIEKELEKYRHHLELLVKERTEELEATNEKLKSTNEELFNQREELENVLVNLKKTQNQLVHSEKMASLGVLASGVAHEINNPLNFIKGGIIGLEEYFDENLKKYKEDVLPLLEGINVGVQRAANIVTSLNHYSRRNDEERGKCDMRDIIDHCIVMLQNQTKNRIEIQKAYSDKAYTIVGNEGKLHQAIMNILSNAVQAIEKKGVISIKTKRLKQFLMITVSDSGCGIIKENITKIFDPFYTTKEAGAGTGLGLSIAYNIIEEHDGTIEVDSVVAEGTNITIKIPLSNKNNG